MSITLGVRFGHVTGRVGRSRRRPPSRVAGGGALSVTAALATAAVLALTGGCASQKPPATPTPAPPSSTASSTTATPTTQAPPTVPAAAQAGTRPGAEAFYTYFWQVYNYSYASLDTTLLRRISDPGCAFCLDQANAIERWKSQGGRFTGGVITVTTVVAAPNNPRRAILVSGVVDQTASTTVNSGGETTYSANGRKDEALNMALKWSGSSWTVLMVGAQAGATP